eukprot:4096191-Ditylum_brightwellii.AAC.1
MVWIPWHEVSCITPIPYTKPGEAQKAATDLSWVEGRELLSNAITKAQAEIKTSITSRCVCFLMDAQVTEKKLGKILKTA